MMNRIAKTFFIVLISLKSYCQYDFVVDSLEIAKSKIKMTELEGTFQLGSHSSNNDVRKYKFNNNKIELTYVQNNITDECDSFTLFGKKIGVKGKFEYDNLACNLDVTSLEVFTFTFTNRKYVLIQSIKAASGIATSYLIFHLFDITTRRIYYTSLHGQFTVPNHALQILIRMANLIFLLYEITVRILIPKHTKSL